MLSITEQPARRRRQPRAVDGTGTGPMGDTGGCSRRALLGRGMALASAGWGVLSGASAAEAADPAPLPPALDLLLRPAAATTRGARRLLLDVAIGGPGLVAVGEAGLLLGSADGGRNWAQLASPTSVMLTAVHFADAAHGWAVGHDGVVLATADSGRQWRRCFDGRQANDLMLASARAQVAAAERLTGTEATVRAARERAADALAAAEDAQKSGPSRPLLAVRFADARRGWVAGAFGQLFATDDGGGQWHYLGDRLPNPEGLHLNHLLVAGDGRLFIAAEAGVVFRSTDGGQRWQRSETGYTGHLYGVVQAQASGHPRALLAHGFNGHLFRSTDDGLSWTAVPQPVRKSLVGAAQVGARTVLLAEDGRLLVSHDAGFSFTAAPQPLAARRHAGFVVSGTQLVAVGAGGVQLHPLPTEWR